MKISTSKRKNIQNTDFVYFRKTSCRLVTALALLRCKRYFVNFTFFSSFYSRVLYWWEVWEIIYIFRCRGQSFIRWIALQTISSLEALPIEWINHCPLDNSISFETVALDQCMVIYPLHSTTQLFSNCAPAVTKLPFHGRSSSATSVLFHRWTIRLWREQRRKYL